MIFPFFISELKKSNNDNQRVGGTGEFWGLEIEYLENSNEIGWI
jgi:hypothetical protein